MLSPENPAKIALEKWFEDEYTFYDRWEYQEVTTKRGKRLATLWWMNGGLQDNGYGFISGGGACLYDREGLEKPEAMELFALRECFTGFLLCCEAYGEEPRELLDLLQEKVASVWERQAVEKKMPFDRSDPWRS